MRKGRKMRAVSEIEIERAFARKKDTLKHEKYYNDPVEVKWSTEKLVEYMISELEEVRRDILARCKNNN